MTQTKVGPTVPVSQQYLDDIAREFKWLSSPADADRRPEYHNFEPPKDAINPEHYQFSNGVEVIDISENLTANAAQALQYIARSSRVDGKNKGNTVEDLNKAVWFINRELERLEARNDRV